VYSYSILIYKEKSFFQELEQFFREELDYVDDLRYRSAHGLIRTFGYLLQVSRDGYFFEGLNILNSTFCVCADGFPDLSKVSLF
jgi:hypothetical protein